MRGTAPTVPVLVEWWQMGCCGRPFSIGDRVTWRLTFAPEDTVTVPDELLVSADWSAETIADAIPAAVLLTAEPIRSVLFAAVPIASPVRLRGLLIADWHGPGPAAPRTAGTVRRIRMLRHRREIGPDRRARAVPGSARTEDIRTCPRWFHSGRTPNRTSYWEEAGVVADIEIDPSAFSSEAEADVDAESEAESEAGTEGNTEGDRGS